MTHPGAPTKAPQREAAAEPIPLSSPDVGPVEEEYLLQAFRSGWIAPVGPDLAAFEAELAAKTGVEHAVALSSGTAALHLALLGVGVKPGDRVVTGTMTFAATANAIVYCSATPVFIDCTPDGNMDPDHLERQLDVASRAGSLPAAIVPVDLLGRPADYSRILPVAQRYGVPVVVDAAESLGSFYGEAPVGSMGRVSAVSFNGNKIMTTSGGGALLTDDADLASYARYLSTQARQPVRHYEHTEVGYNYRLSNLLAALGRAQLLRLEEMIERRRRVRARYEGLIRDVAGVELFGAENPHRDNAWLSAILIDPQSAGFEAEQLGAWLAQHQVETRPLWKPMHLQPAFGGYPCLSGHTAERLFATGLALPSGSAMTEAQLSRVLSVMEQFLCG
ncbi:MAG TPA: aminotransferase class I/II-fold pyridoxal phosphate-dependent enzyme [Candidatus Nesterenkonia stercoripullorum]|uniref:Aminotransferase class I/II-fold pyridoxal phosphate-dependent enzyme n=1 Tax=Candidatus Nesterenkonia stercoripullorum TaxID=2838701 RepID=A0A9D1URC8_9MICC|nr:aminotransferase class I/II-fold pyridoxal phosphate-dependent enzyme [Candidatus Nesterenkonia stercoripullorum]